MTRPFAVTCLFVVLLLSGILAVICSAYDKPPKYDGRTLTPAEKDAVGDAIWEIMTPPPDTITYNDQQGRPQKVSCSDLGQVLWNQLWSGRIEAETKATESTVNHVSDGPSTAGDQMNIDPRIIGEAISNPPAGQPWLQETLVHEGVHKWQTVAGANRDSLEIQALSVAMAYKLATGVAPNSTLYQWEDSLRRRHQRNYLNWQDQWRVMWSMNEDTIPTARPILWYIKYDPQGSDSFTSFSPDTSETSTFNDWSFGPTRAADFMIFSNHYLLPPGHDLAVICGSAPMLMMGRVLALDIFQGQVYGTIQMFDFGPPLWPPMSFYSMTHFPGTGQYYMMDTLNQQIEVLQDTNLDSVPDQFTSVFANAVWAGFAPLLNKRGIEVAEHPLWGGGICAYEKGKREEDVIDPDDSCLFLKDVNGDQIADWCEMMPLYQFISFKPCIDESPWAGDMSVPLFATWNHTIQVWTSDSLGEVYGEFLGGVLMGAGVNEECALVRTLLAGEFVIAVDQVDGSQLSLATRVIDPAPQKVTLSVMTDGALRLAWASVPGADHYLIYASEDAELYFETGLVAEEPEIILPLPSLLRQYYYVTAEK
jgi:hypothetical protein